MAGCECVFSCEWNKYARQTYLGNFPGSSPFALDITKVDVCDVPNHDILLAGFPCQPFSSAGLKRGFADPTQGTLFFDVLRIIKFCRPEAFVLENVSNLVSHDNGNTLKIILSELQKAGYSTDFKLINSQSWVPQKRKRIFIIGYKTAKTFDWDLEKPTTAPTLKTILHPEDGSELKTPYTLKSGLVDSKYTLTPKTWKYLQCHAAKHAKAGNGFGYSLVKPDDVARTISARYYKDGSEILVSRGRRIPRKLTPRECARLMGFPDTFQIPVSDTQAYRQFGNSVVVPVIHAIAKKVTLAIKT